MWGALSEDRLESEWVKAVTTVEMRWHTGVTIFRERPRVGGLISSFEAMYYSQSS